MNYKAVFTEAASEFLSDYLKENSSPTANGIFKLTPEAQDLVLEVVDGGIPSLTPLQVGKRYTDIKFSNKLSLEKTISILDNAEGWFHPESAPEGVFVNMVVVAESATISAYKCLPGVFPEIPDGGYYILVGESCVPFTTVDILGVEEFTPGWQPSEGDYWDAETGVVDLIKLGENIWTVLQSGDLNGTLFGQASEPYEQPKFNVGDKLSKLYYNKSLSSDYIVSLLENIPEEYYHEISGDVMTGLYVKIIRGEEELGSICNPAIYELSDRWKIAGPLHDKWSYDIQSESYDWGEGISSDGEDTDITEWCTNLNVYVKGEVPPQINGILISPEKFI